MSLQKTTHPMSEWVLHLRNLDSRLRGNDKEIATPFSRIMLLGIKHAVFAKAAP